IGVVLFAPNSTEGGLKTQAEKPSPGFYPFPLKALLGNFTHLRSKHFWVIFSLCCRNERVCGR
ncbi:MAG: hypothetical protein DRH10_09605, partial [Deltaproteobacteria bacterium]